MKKILSTLLVLMMLVTLAMALAIENTIIDMDSYIVPEYEVYNSPASENGRGGDMLRIKGNVSRYIDDDGFYCIILTQDDGKEWLVGVGSDRYVDSTQYKSWEGKSIEVFGEYLGFSGVHSLPTISIMEVGGILERIDGTYVGDLYDVNNDPKAWVAAYAYKEAYSAENDYKAVNVLCSGIVVDVFNLESIKKMYVQFIQYIDGEFIIANGSFTYDAFPEMADLAYGDSLSMYFILDGNGKDYLLTYVTKENNAGFSFEEYIDYYKNQCKVYTFKEIERNPNKVKGEYAVVSGEVIQVLEYGLDVELRVNISQMSWGYTDTIYVTYSRKSEDEDRILEDDIVTVWGTLEGLMTYETVSNTTVTISHLAAEYIQIETLN